MRILVLVVTPTPGFGSLIQQTLEDSGRYQVSLAVDASQALQLAGSVPFALGILDACEEGEPPGSEQTQSDRSPSDQTLSNQMPVGELIRSLREKLPGMRVVIVPPGNDAECTLIENARPDGTLTKPFYLPELLGRIDHVMQSSPSSPPPATAQPPPASPGARLPDAPAWLADVSRAAQYLARLSLESAAQAALIVHSGELWAYAGELDQPAARELAQIVAHHWSRGGSSDLARFIRLETTQSEFMLYATGLAGHMVLALVFDVETPFSKIRSQASSLARSLASPPGGGTEGGGTEGGENNHQAPEIEQSPPPSAEEEPQPPSAPLPPLFEDVPPPQASGWGKSPPGNASSLETGPFVPGEASGNRSSSLEDDRLREAAFPVARPQWESEPGLYRGLVELAQHGPTIENEGFLLSKAEPPASEAPFSDPLAETRPILVGQPSAESLSDGPEVVPDEGGGFDSLQSASVAVCNLNYACMLIPRLPQHHLTGDLGVRLSDWVVQLCLAFGWRLGHLAVRPDYLLWIVNVSPTVSPSYLVRLMRQHTSQRIFTQFSELAQENPSGDFWAPGYLVMSSTHAPPVDVMNNFIQGTRRRQGAFKSPFHSRTMQE